MHDDGLTAAEVDEAIKSDKITEIEIQNKADLRHYFTEDFAKVFFTKGEYV